MKKIVFFFTLFFIFSLDSVFAATELTWLNFPIVPGIFDPTIGFFYSPSIILEEGKYKMWTTVNDRIRYYESIDGTNWSGGQVVLSAQPNTWEDDGSLNPLENTQGGISDPRVIIVNRPGWKYTMYYTAGTYPNTEIRGGLGVVVSN